MKISYLPLRVEAKAIFAAPPSGVGTDIGVAEGVAVGVEVSVGVKVVSGVVVLVGGGVAVTVGGTGVALVQEAIMIRQTTPTINHISLCEKAGMFIILPGLAKDESVSSLQMVNLILVGRQNLPTDTTASHQSKNLYKIRKSTPSTP
jgi:hypothetical protein